MKGRIPLLDFVLITVEVHKCTSWLLWSNLRSTPVQQCTPSRGNSKRSKISPFIPMIHNPLRHVTAKNFMEKSKIQGRQLEQPVSSKTKRTVIRFRWRQDSYTSHKFSTAELLHDLKRNLKTQQTTLLCLCFACDPHGSTARPCEESTINLPREQAAASPDALPTAGDATEAFFFISFLG